jgi:pyruvate dehydrogenase E2 component (dihydrolipoamide acetyltransferase)
VTDLRALTMPKWGIEMTEGTLSEWKVAPGDRITKGQIIALVETDKIVSEIEAEQEATVARLVAEQGEIYPVGALLAVLTDGSAGEAEVEAFIAAFRPSEGSAAASAQPGAGAATAAAPTAAAATAPAARQAAQPRHAIPEGIAISPAARELALAKNVDVARIQGSGRNGRITFQDVDQATKPAVTAKARAAVSIVPPVEPREDFRASPYAKRLARRHALDLSTLTGSGARGRISRHDVMQALDLDAGQGTPPPAAAQPNPWETPAQVLRMSPMRKAIARQLSLSKSTIPHFYLRASVRIDALVALRNREKQLNAAEAPTLNDYFVRAAALALLEVPDVNIQVHDDTIHRFAHADISIAVATDKGLITPIVRAADTKSVAEIAMESRLLAQRAREGKLKPEEFQGGSFSVSNLGKFGIDQFDAIINPPQGAILAIGAARTQPTLQNHALAFSSIVNLSLSCDHRAIDGAVGAGFVAALRDLLESPEQLIAAAD